MEETMKCVICKNGETADGETTVTKERGSTVLVVRCVPTRICGTCGKAYISGTITDAILRRAEEMQRQGVEIDIRRFAVA